MYFKINFKDLKMRIFRQKLIFLIGLLFILSACATSDNYENIVSSWLGFTETKLISSYGLPDKVYEVDNIKFISYEKRSTSYPDVFCNTVFEIRDGEVVNYSFSGSGCKAF